MRTPKDFEHLSTRKFNVTTFWVQIHNVLFNFMTYAMAQHLGEVIGVVEEIESDEKNEWIGSFMRIHIIIDVMKPLRWGVRIKTIARQSIWSPIMYEKFPDFCFACGLVRHSIRECQGKGPQGWKL